jgi:hypothetical protein
MGTRRYPLTAAEIEDMLLTFSSCLALGDEDATRHYVRYMISRIMAAQGRGK